MSLDQSIALSAELAVRASSKSFLGYLESVVIDSRPHPRLFWKNADEWQRELARSIASRIEAVAGVRDLESVVGPSRFFWVLPRGHDKTTAIGRALNWVLGFGRRSVRASVAAADKDQAAIIREAMKAEAAHNSWLDRRLTFAEKKVLGQNDSRLNIMAADAASTWGANEDLYVIDEITWWQNDKLWLPLASAFSKRPGTVVLIISNAGERKTWQEEVLFEARRDPSVWSVFEAPEGKTLASWIDPVQRQKDRALLPPYMARRAFDNVWVNKSEAGGYLTLLEAKGCEDESLPLFVSTPQRGVLYQAAIDYGPKKDRTALALGHLCENPLCVVVDRLDVIQGSPLSPVPVATVERWVDELLPVFHPDIVVDPYQMEGLVQKYEHTRKVTRFEARGGKSNYEMAECLRSLVTNKQIKWNPTAGQLHTPSGWETFADELSQLVTKVTTYGYRFDHLAGHHDDRAVAVGMMALKLVQDPTRGKWVGPRHPVKENLSERRADFRRRLSLNIKRHGEKLYGIK